MTPTDPAILDHIAASPDQAGLDFAAVGKLLPAARARSLMSLQAMADRLTELGVPTTASTLSKYETGRLKTIPAKLLKALVNMTAQSTKLRLGWAAYPDYAFLHCLPGLRVNEDPPMDSIQFEGPFEVSDLLSELVAERLDIVFTSEWRLGRFDNGVGSRVERLTPHDQPLWRVRNNQIAVAGHLTGIQPYPAFYLDACRLGFSLRDRVAYALAKTLAQIPVTKGQPSLELVKGAWVPAFGLLVELASSWVRLKGNTEHRLTKAEVETLSQIEKWMEHRLSDNLPHAANTRQEAEEASARIKKAIDTKSSGPLFFVGNITTLFMLESQHPVAVLLNNDALSDITNLAYLLNQGQNSGYLNSVFFPAHHAVVRHGLNPPQMLEVQRLKARWNYLVPRINSGSSHVYDVSTIIDNVLEGKTTRWMRDVNLFEQFVRRRGLELGMWA